MQNLNRRKEKSFGIRDQQDLTVINGTDTNDELRSFDATLKLKHEPELTIFDEHATLPIVLPICAVTPKEENFLTEPNENYPLVVQQNYRTMKY